MPPKRIASVRPKAESRSDTDAQSTRAKRPEGAVRRSSDTEDNLRRGVLSRNAAAAASRLTPRQAPPLKPETAPLIPVTSAQKAEAVVPSMTQESNMAGYQLNNSPPYAPSPVLARLEASDDNLGDISSGAESGSEGRVSMLPPFRNRAGINMDMAKLRATDIFQAGKTALEQSGNLKREIKADVSLALEGLYKTALELVDSRHRHKTAEEKARAQGARDLAHAERAHSRQLASLVANHERIVQTLTTQIEKLVGDVGSMRSCIDYEVSEPLKAMREIREDLKELRRRPVPSSAPVIADRCRLDPQDLEKIVGGANRLQSSVTRLEVELQELPRRVGEQVPAPLPPARSSSPTLIPCPELAPRLDRIEGTISDLQSTIKEVASRQGAPTECAGAGALRDLLGPVTAKLDTVLHEVRDIAAPVPTLAPSSFPSLAAELSHSSAQTSDVKKPPPAKRAHGIGSDAYARVAALPKRTPPSATLVVASIDPRETSEGVIKAIQRVANTQVTGARVDAVRKVRDQKVVLRCRAEEDAKKMARQLREAPAGLTVSTPTSKSPLVEIRDVLTVYTDQDILDSLRKQNKELFRDLENKDSGMCVKYRKRARNNLECHPVIEVAPKLWQRLVQAGRVYIGIRHRLVRDQSPLVQCSICLGFGHPRKLCPESEEACAHCIRIHRRGECPRRAEGAEPQCINCHRAKRPREESHHSALDRECPEAQKWDSIARSRVAYC